MFWEQYLGLRQSLGLALLCALAAVFLVVAVLLLNLWAATLVVLALAVMVIQLLGVMGVLGIKLSAIPAVLLIVAVGIGVHFTVHICLVSGIRTREQYLFQLCNFYEINSQNMQKNDFIRSLVLIVCYSCIGKDAKVG
jgi:hypothetical protein